MVARTGISKGSSKLQDMNRKRFLGLMAGAALTACVGVSAQTKTEESTKTVLLSISGMS